MNNYVIGAIVVAVLIGGAIFVSQKDSASDAKMAEEKAMMEKEAMMKMEMEAQEKAMMDDKAMNDKMMDDKAMAGVMVGGAMMLPTLDIVDNAAQAKNVTTVVAAVKAAGLVDTLKGPGPFTVFAPTNAAFDKLPAGTVTTLLKADMKADLTSILTYHVVAGRYTAADLKDGMTLTTVNGATLKVSNVNGVVKINGAAMVETADVISSNGVTHVIDTVLMPPKA
jgi:uncharacterized surface protein with fasciclin (FAS1) repeats